MRQRDDTHTSTQHNRDIFQGDMPYLDITTQRDVLPQVFMDPMCFLAHEASAVVHHSSEHSETRGTVFWLKSYGQRSTRDWTKKKHPQSCYFAFGRYLCNTYLEAPKTWLTTNKRHDVSPLASRDCQTSRAEQVLRRPCRAKNQSSHT